MKIWHWNQPEKFQLQWINIVIMQKGFEENQTDILCSYSHHTQILLVCFFLFTFLPHNVKIQYVQFKSHTEYFLLPLKIAEKISIQSMLLCNLKGVSTISYKHTIQPFSMVVNWPEIGRFMEASTMFYIAHIAFLLCGAELTFCVGLTTAEHPPTEMGVSDILYW